MTGGLFDDNKTIKLLGAGDFQEKENTFKLKSKRCHAVLFFANWCGHCQNLKPAYNNFADMCQFIKVAAVDSEANSTLMENINKTAKIRGNKVQIQGFPTIWFYKNCEPMLEYQGERTPEKLKDVAMKICNEKCKCHEYK